MAYALNALITIGKYRFTSPNEVVINSSWKELGDTCTIKLPNLKGRLERSIAVGDAVTVKLGYNGELRTEFVGYVSKISPKTPMEVFCEDGIWTLRRSTLTAGKSWKSVTLSGLLKEILSPLKTTLSPQIPAVTLAPFRIEKGTTLAQALQKLNEDYLLTAYFRGDTLFVGLPYTEFSATRSEADRKAGRFVRANFQGNVAADGLTFNRADAVLLKAKAISILPNNKRIEVSVGDDAGEERTLHYYNIASETALRQMATADLQKYKYDGYTGTVTLYGNVAAIHSGTALVSDARYPERDGSYVIDSIKTTFGLNGYRKELTLGIKVSI